MCKDCVNIYPHRVHVNSCTIFMCMYPYRRWKQVSFTNAHQVTLPSSLIAICVPCRGERIVFWWPNTNTNIIRLPKNDRIWIRILFGFTKMTEYEYEYYSVSQKWPNTNTNIIRLSKKDQIQIRILFSFPKMTEYEYYSDSQKYIAEKSQTNANSVGMQSCMHAIQVNIWIHTVGNNVPFSQMRTMWSCISDPRNFRAHL